MPTAYILTGDSDNDEPVFDASRASDGDVIRLGSAEIRGRVDGRELDRATPTEILKPTR